MTPPPPAVKPAVTWRDFAPRIAVTLALFAVYYAAREPFAEWLFGTMTTLTGEAPSPASPRVIGVSILIALMLAVWRKVVFSEPKLQAPLLITVILALSDASFGVLETHAVPPWLVSLSGGAWLDYTPTFITICVTMLTEVVLGRFFWGKWPNLTSAYITGISAGILVKSSALWPFLLCGMISITSKYVLRIYGRHLWNPTNFGMTMMLFLTASHTASLNVQAGNNGLAIAVIWVLGGMIMFKLGRFHIPLAFIAAFIPLAILRSQITGHPWQTELAPITSPMFSLYIFFMITDPPTTTRAKWSQILVAVLVAGMETTLRLVFKDIHSLYHALFTVGPAANLVEIAAGRIRTRNARIRAIRHDSSDAVSGPGVDLPSALIGKESRI